MLGRRKQVNRTISAKPASARMLEVSDLHTSFRTDRGLVKAVNGVSFTLDRGKTLGIVGESGSGKSVLSRSIMGLLPRRNVVREGSVEFEGTEIAKLSPTAMREFWGTEMAMVFQDPMTSLNPVVKIGRQITESLHYHLDMSRDQADATALALMKSVGIPESERRLNEYPHQMSGGMRQRIVIAVALACGPKLLFADEPTTALDVTVQAVILNLLQQQQRERDMGMVLVTHDLGWSPDGPTTSQSCTRARSWRRRPRARCSRRCGCRTRRACSSRFPNSNSRATAGSRSSAVVRPT